MADLRTMHDVRSVRDISTQASLARGGSIFLELHRLSSESIRLERQITLWDRKQQRALIRIQEIEQQMKLLQDSQSRALSMAATRPARNLHHVVLEY